MLAPFSKKREGEGGVNGTGTLAGAIPQWTGGAQRGSATIPGHKAGQGLPAGHPGGPLGAMTVLFSAFEDLRSAWAEVLGDIANLNLEMQTVWIFTLLTESCKCT